MSPSGVGERRVTVRRGRTIAAAKGRAFVVLLRLFAAHWGRYRGAKYVCVGLAPGGDPVVARTAARAGALRSAVVSGVVVFGAGGRGVGRVNVGVSLGPAVFRRAVRRAVLATALARWFSFFVLRIETGRAGACGVAGVTANGIMYLSAAASRVSRGGCVSREVESEEECDSNTARTMLIMRPAPRPKFPNPHGLQGL